MRFDWKIKGHDKVLMSLERDIESGNVAHGYLFAGQEGIGKYTVAKTMARILQCENNFCGVCVSCREIEKGYHGDTLEIIDDGESIKVDPVKDILEKMHLTKTSRFRILIIENIERIVNDAAGKLLKIMEEPPEGVIFLITSANLKEVLPTLVSRSRVIKMEKLADNIVKEVVEAECPLATPETVEKAVLCAQGRPGRAIQLIQDEEELKAAANFLEAVARLLESGDKTDSFVFIEKLAAAAKEEKSKAPVFEFLEAVEIAARQRIHQSAESENYLPNAEKYVKLLQKTYEARRLLKNNVNARLLLENLMLST